MVNHILTFMPMYFMMDILVIEVIKKLMDIDSVNKIIWNLETKPTLYSLLFVQKTNVSITPSSIMILCYNREGPTMSLLLCLEHYSIYDSRRHAQ